MDLSLVSDEELNAEYNSRQAKSLKIAADKWAEEWKAFAAQRKEELSESVNKIVQVTDEQLDALEEVFVNYLDSW